MHHDAFIFTLFLFAPFLFAENIVMFYRLMHIGIFVSLSFALKITGGLKIFVIGASQGNYGGVIGFLHGMLLWKMMILKKLEHTMTTG